MSHKLFRPLIIIILLIIVVFFFYELISVNNLINSSLKYDSNIDIPNELTGYASFINLPSISIDLDPPIETNSSSCNIPTRVDNSECTSFCNNSDAYELIIGSNSNTLFNILLQPGRYCTIHKPVPCSENYGYLVFGDGWECISKFPDVVGGVGASVPNYSFYKNDEFLQNNIIKDKEGNIIDIPNRYIDLKDRENIQLECNDLYNGIKMIQLSPTTFKCVIDPCQTIPGTDSHWDPVNKKCICGINQIHLIPNDELSPCIGANYIVPGYDELTSTQTDIIECQTRDSEYTGGVVIPCPNFGQQVSTFGSNQYKVASGDSVNILQPWPNTGWVHLDE